MSKEVAFEGLLIGELLRAKVAMVGLLTRVYAEMGVQVCLPHEGLETQVTVVMSLSLVTPYVVDQRAFSQEGLRAEVALEPLVAGVDLQVLPEFALAPEIDRTT